MLEANKKNVKLRGTKIFSKKNWTNTYFTSGFQSHNLQARWNHHSFLLVIWRGNTFKSLQSFQSSLATFCFVGNHSSYNAFKDLAGSTVMERSSGRFDITTKSQKLVQFQLVTVEISRLVDSFGSDDDDFVTVQDEFSNGGGQSTQQMATAINHNRLKLKKNYA